MATDTKLSYRELPKLASSVIMVYLILKKFKKSIFQTTMSLNGGGVANHDYFIEQIDVYNKSLPFIIINPQ